MAKYTTYRQHVPLRVPSNWNNQEKMFVAQLEELFEDIYKQYNRIKLTDMSTDFRKLVEEIGDNSSKYVAEIAAGAYTVSTLTNLSGIGSLGPNETLFSRIEHEAGRITSLIAKTGVNDLPSGQSLLSRINTETGRIDTLNEKTGISSLGLTETLYGKIDELITKTGVNDLTSGETLYSKIAAIPPDDDSWKQIFRKIGADGYTPTGITEIGEDGITVTHTNGKTVIDQYGFAVKDGTDEVRLVMDNGDAVMTSDGDIVFEFVSGGTNYTINISDIYDAVYGGQNGNT